MKILQVAGVLLGLLCGIGTAAEYSVFVDDAFPYRLSCKSEWQEAEKSDTVFLLENSTLGVKLWFQLKKYDIDTAFFNLEEREWSRWQYATNTAIADGFGTLWFSDSGEAVSIGSLPSYRYFAYFRMVTGSDTVWLAQYDNWTEYKGTGYLVSLFGDTSSMVKNFTQYKVLVDSLRIEKSATSQKVFHRAVPFPAKLTQKNRGQTLFHDLLGRPERIVTGKVPSVLVGKEKKRCFLR